MANPKLRLRDSANVQNSDGYFNSVEDNLVNVIERIFEGELSDNEDWANHKEVLLQERPLIEKGDPKYMCIKELPSVFVWMDGAELDVRGMGTHLNNVYSPRRGKKHTVRRTFYLNVQYIPGEAGDRDAHVRARTIGHFLARGLINHITLNSESHNTMIPEITFFPQPGEVDSKGFCFVATAHIKMKVEMADKLATAI